MVLAAFGLPPFCCGIGPPDQGCEVELTCGALSRANSWPGGENGFVFVLLGTVLLSSLPTMRALLGALRPVSCCAKRITESFRFSTVRCPPAKLTASTTSAINSARAAQRD